MERHIESMSSHYRYLCQENKVLEGFQHESVCNTACVVFKRTHIQSYKQFRIYYVNCDKLKSKDGISKKSYQQLDKHKHRNI
ncbi:hypothetical protein HanRHA438_Chr06g0283881 [Helianthus annuus]|nr:hypothetical protein HanRHA438_Chr06g0283881 [Helianthus annuus]